jgi:hypothetical protein
VQVYLDFNACFILKIGNNKLNRNYNAKKLTNFILKHSRIENIKLMLKIKIDVNSEKNSRRIVEDN